MYIVCFHNFHRGTPPNNMYHSETSFFYIVVRKNIKSFLVHIFDGFNLIKTADVSYFFSENGVVRAFLSDGNSVTINQSLNDLEQQLNPDLFFRANRQYTVNIDSIDKLTNFFKYRMTISLHGFPELRIVVSKDKIIQLKNWLDR
jgi:two-component system, LytTR family, response regulator LytT